MTDKAGNMTVEEYRKVSHKIASRRSPGTPHGDLIKSIVQNLVLIPGVMVIQHNTGALRGIGQGGKERLIRYGYPGMADLYVRVRPRGGAGFWRTIWMECKVAGDTQKPAQVGFQASMEKCGDQYYIIRETEEALAIVRYVRGIE